MKTYLLREPKTVESQKIRRPSRPQPVAAASATAVLQPADRAPHGPVLYIGLDVHSDSIAVSLAPGASTEVRRYGMIGGTHDDVLRLAKKLTAAHLGVTLKFCYEAGPHGYLLQRFLLSADVHYRDTFRVFGQLMSALENGRINGPRPTDKDVFDLHQGFLDVKLDLDDTAGLVTRVGRQEMYYGSQRLVSVRESPNIRLSFDGLRLIYENDVLNISAFATKPVKIEEGYFDNEPNPNSTFWGLYGVAPLPILPGGNVDFYYLGIENDQAVYNQGTGRELRHSIGTRIWGRKEGWDYNVELVYQFGSFGDADISAWTAASDTGYTFANTPLHPRLFLKADIASGDRNPANPNLNTFNALFPKGAYFSETGLIGPANIIDVHPGIELQLTRRLSFITDWDFFWRESTGDGIYNNALKLVRPGGSSSARYIGSQAQAMLQWNISRHFTASAVYAHFFAGEFLEQSPSGKDVNYVSGWVTFRF